MVERLLIVVPESEQQATRDIVAALAVSGWEQTIHLAGGPTRRGPGQAARQESERILRLADNISANDLIITKEICCDQKILNTRSELYVQRPSVTLLRRQILKKELDIRGLHWRHILESRIEYWDSRKSDVDHWLRQFDHLGERWVGEGLLRQVDVIAPIELSKAFEVPAQAKLGANFVFTFMLEDDHASSSNRIGAMLTRMYGPLVRDFANVLQTAPPGSRLVVCEDALWTGAELRKLLARFATGGDLQAHAQDKRILFRHCVVSDYGIWVGRHFLERNKLDTVDLWLGGGQRFVQVLSAGLHEKTIRSNWHLSPKEFDDWLSGQVRPLAFQNSALWAGQGQRAQGICERIGTQLVHKYADEHRKDWSSTVKEGFSIGAGRFGCTVMFSHSIPKVCLPLFWLGGPVNIEGRLVDWKPLFYDARRA